MNARLLLLASAFVTLSAHAQFRPPAFLGGPPGLSQFQAIQMQRHQARTLLYREALEELRKNPAAADVPECSPGQSPQGGHCLARPGSTAESTVALAPSAVASPPLPTPTPAPTPKTAPSTVPTPLPAPVAAAVPRQELPTQAPPPPAAAPLPPKPAPQKAVETRRLALLFGNNDYPAPIPGLETPIADVEKIASTLRSRFGYDARVVKNASKAQIIESLNGMAVNAGKDDSVLLFYAGHGYLMEDTNMGFWIPVDGSVKTAANWVSNKDISKLLAAIPARQLILVSDSCFSGSLTREQKVSYSGEIKAEDVLRKRSVLVFSSGGDEPVSDEGKDGHSIFAWSLIKTLDELNGTTPGQTVWRSVHGKVTKEYPQEPQYGAVLSAGHSEGGEYLFQVR